jgi:hypothetical protein
LGAENSVVDNAFFDHSNQVSFADDKVASLIKTSHYVEPGCYALSAPNIESKSLFLAYPNPVPDKLFVTSDFFDGIVDYQLFLLDGKLLSKGKLDLGKPFDIIDLSSFPKGTFAIHVTNGIRTESRKLFKA